LAPPHGDLPGSGTAPVITAGPGTELPIEPGVSVLPITPSRPLTTRPRAADTDFSSRLARLGRSDAGEADTRRPETGGGGKRTHPKGYGDVDVNDFSGGAFAETKSNDGSDIGDILRRYGYRSYGYVGNVASGFDPDAMDNLNPDILRRRDINRLRADTNEYLLDGAGGILSPITEADDLEGSQSSQPGLQPSGYLNTPIDEDYSVQRQKSDASLATEDAAFGARNLNSAIGREAPASGNGISNQSQSSTMPSVPTREPIQQALPMDAVAATPPPPPVGQNQGQGTVSDSTAPTTGLAPNTSSLGFQLAEQQRVIHSPMEVRAAALMSAVRRHYDDGTRHTNGIDMMYEDQRSRALQQQSRDPLSGGQDPVFARIPVQGTIADPNTPATGPGGPPEFINLNQTVSPRTFAALNADVQNESPIRLVNRRRSGSSVAALNTQLQDVRRSSADTVDSAMKVVNRRRSGRSSSVDTPAYSQGIGGGGRAPTGNNGTITRPSTRANPVNYVPPPVFDANYTDRRSPMAIAMEFNQGGGGGSPNVSFF
jgi:hypothetical protein